MFLIKTKHGHFIPYDDADDEDSSKISIGEVVKCSRSRNIAHHKKAFALLKIGFDNQSKYEHFEIYRKVITILSGNYFEVMTDSGPQYIPKSLSFESMSQKKFNEWYEDAVKIIARDLNVTIEELLNET